MLLLVVIVDGFARMSQGHRPDVALGLVTSVGLVFIALALERRRSWARWVVGCVAAFKLLTLAIQVLAPAVPKGVHIAFDYAAIGREVVVVLCLVAATLLVFLPGRAWFEPRDS